MKQLRVERLLLRLQKYTATELRKSTAGTYDDRRNEGCDTRLGDPFCDSLKAIAVCLIIVFIDRKVETETTVNLNVNVPRTGECSAVSRRLSARPGPLPQDAPAEIDDLVGSFSF